MTLLSLSDETMHAAIDARDVSYEGQFVVGVTSTGIYCRPGCPARRPKPENRRFFVGPAAAESMGYRACKRCRPEAVSPPALDGMVALARHIAAHADERLPLTKLATVAGLSVAQSQRRFKAAFGLTIAAFHRAARHEAFRAALAAGQSVTEACFAAGYGSMAQVQGGGAKPLGMTPSAFARGGLGETIYYAIRQTRWGLLGIAATARGVCFVQFRDTEEAILTRLKSDFPKATIQETSPSAALSDWADALETHLAERGPRPDLPLDLRGTAFQRAAWAFLLSIPDGTTVTYSEMAAGLGNPKAVRAAASACARNRVAILVPCHRVLRTGGGLGGYAWGLEMKQALLEQEGAVLAGSMSEQPLRNADSGHAEGGCHRLGHPAKGTGNHDRKSRPGEEVGDADHYGR